MTTSVDPARRGAGPGYVASGARLNNLPAGNRPSVRVWCDDGNHGLGKLTLFGGAGAGRAVLARRHGTSRHGVSCGSHSAKRKIGRRSAVWTAGSAIKALDTVP